MRDLGVIVDSTLKFEQHVSAVVHKAHTRANLILLEYCTPVWSPQYNYLTEKVERVQRHFTKRLHGLKNKSYTERLKLIGLQSLERRRLNYDLILTYKILHGITETSLIRNFSRQEYSRTRGHGWKLEKPFCSWDIYKHFLIIAS